jgi:hypothetical protein
MKVVVELPQVELDALEKAANNWADKAALERCGNCDVRLYRSQEDMDLFAAVSALRGARIREAEKFNSEVPTSPASRSTKKGKEKK